eukprot:6137760-Pyramimonas_sp.AAC.1
MRCVSLGASARLQDNPRAPSTARPKLTKRQCDHPGNYANAFGETPRRRRLGRAASALLDAGRLDCQPPELLREP